MSDTTTPEGGDNKAPDNTNPGDKAPDKTPETGGDKAPDLAAIVATLTAQVAELTAEKTKAAEVAEAARVASLSEAERIAEERKALDAEKKGLVSQARQAAADKLGILPKALALAPDVDPRTPEGAKALETWAKDNPEFVKSKTGDAPGFTPPPKSPLAAFLTGEKKHPIYSVEAIRKMLNA